MKKLKFLAVILSVVVILASCEVNSESPVATVNGRNILTNEFMFYLQQGKSMASTAATNQGDKLEAEADWESVVIDGVKASEYAKNQAEKSIKQVNVMLEKAKEIGLELTDEDKTTIESNKKSFVEQTGGMTQYQSYIAGIGVTDAVVDAAITNSIYANKMYTEIYAEDSKYLTFDAADLNDYYIKNYVAAKHILILTDPSGKTTDETALAQLDAVAKTKAQSILDRINGGEDFDTLMNELSEDTGLESYPNGYVFTKGKMVAEFETAAFALKEGEYTKELVKTNYGYHIIKRIPLPVEGNDYNTAISESKTGSTTDKFEALIDKWAKEMGFEFKDKTIKKIKLV